MFRGDQGSGRFIGRCPQGRLWAVITSHNHAMQWTRGKIVRVGAVAAHGLHHLPAFRRAHDVRCHVQHLAQSVGRRHAGSVCLTPCRPRLRRYRRRRRGGIRPAAAAAGGRLSGGGRPRRAATRRPRRAARGEGQPAVCWILCRPLADLQSRGQNPAVVRSPVGVLGFETARPRRPRMRVARPCFFVHSANSKPQGRITASIT